jgi:hypothetical protein
MQKQTKYIIGGAVALAGIVLLIRSLKNSDNAGMQQNKQESLPGSVSNESNPIVRNYFGQSGALSNVFPRGIRNNNPGNLIKTDITWGGEIPHSKNTDGRFEQFSTFEYGVRAMIKQLKTDISRGHNTLSKLIAKYAPITENPTSNYVSFVSQKTGYGKDTVLTADKATLKKLVKAMALFENGASYPVYDSHFEDAYKLI